MYIRSGSFAKLLRRRLFHDFLPSALRVTQGHRIGPPVRRVTSMTTPALCPCTFCSDRHSSAINERKDFTGLRTMPSVIFSYNRYWQT